MEVKLKEIVIRDKQGWFKMRYTTEPPTEDIRYIQRFMANKNNTAEVTFEIEDEVYVTGLKAIEISYFMTEQGDIFRYR